MSQYSTYLCYSTHMYMYHLPHAWPMASEPTAPLLPSVQPAPLQGPRFNVKVCVETPALTPQPCSCSNVLTPGAGCC